MKLETEQRLKQAIEFLDVRLEYSNDLSEEVSGFLTFDTDTALIVVNARKPSCDHALTIAHELGHYIMHQDRPRKFTLPSFLYRPWKSKIVRRAARYVRMRVLKQFSAEWEADFWAFIFLMSIGAIDELLAIVELYPEKKYFLWLSALAIALGAARRLETNLASLPLDAVGFLKSSLSRHRLGDEE